MIKELLETEKKYLKDLNSITNVYQKPLEQSGIVQDSQLNLIFKNLKLIIGVNTNLLSQMQKYYDEFIKLSGVYSGGNSLGKIFVKFAPFLKNYTGI